MRKVEDLTWGHTEKWTCESCFGEWCIETDGWGNYNLTFKPFEMAPEHPAKYDKQKAKSFQSAEEAKTAVMQEDFHMESDYGLYVDRHMKSLGRLGKTTERYPPCERESFETDVSWA